MQRIEVLRRHLSGQDSAHGGFAIMHTAARGALALPRFDANVMENYLDDLASLKEEVYSVFEHNPALLPACMEGLTKGKFADVLDASRQHEADALLELPLSHMLITNICPSEPVQRSTGTWCGHSCTSCSRLGTAHFAFTSTTSRSTFTLESYWRWSTYH